MMLLLQSHGKMTTRELADKLEVSERTILRDMDALSAAGVPVVAERGQYGGWRLLGNFRSAISGMKLDDLKSLFILPSDRMLEELAIETGGQDIRRKLMASMPEAVRRSAKAFMEKIYIDTGTWKPSASEGERLRILREVQAALWEDRKLLIDYRNVSGERSERQVCPLGLVAKGNTWYLVALNEQGEYRTYRLTRIHRAEVMAESFTRPEHFDLIDHWKRSMRQFAASLPSYEIEVTVDRSILGRVTYTDKFLQMAEFIKDEAGQPAQLRLRFDTEEEAVRYVLGYGGRMKVERPAHLIPLIVEEARQVLRLYEEA
jgi:predicted DNA-binding transcriptional regulator YafY